MNAPWLSLLLVAWPTVVDSSQSALDPGTQTNHLNGTFLGSQAEDPLKVWMKNLDIPLIANMSGEMPMGMGVFEIRGGYCTGLRLDRVQSEDLSSDLVLEFGLKVSGLAISCFVNGYSEGPVDINITFEDSSLNASLQINPYTSDMVVDMPLPMGQLRLTGCASGMAATAFTHAGSGMLAETLDWVGDDIVEVIGMAINEPLCEGLKLFLEANGTAAAAQAADLVSMLLLPPFPEPEPTALKELLDWQRYPPIGVAKALLSERFGLFADRILNIVNVTELNAKLVETDEVRLNLSYLHIEGRGEHHGPGLELQARESSLGIVADLADLTFKTAFDLDVTLPEQPLFSQQIGVTLGLEQVAVAIRAMVDETTLTNLQLDDAMHSPRCLAQCSEGTTDPPEGAVAIEELRVKLRPLLEIHTPGSLATDGSNLINIIIGALLNAYLPTVNALVNGALGISRNQLDELIWKSMNSLPPCSREDMFFVLSEDGVLAFWSMAIFITLLGMPIALLAHFFWKKAAPTSANHTSEGEPSAAPADVNATAISVRTAAEVPPPLALACESCVPRALAVYYPFAVISVMALFLYADLDIGTTVTMVMESDGRSATIGPLFSFSLISTVSHCWASEAYFIAVLTVVASGVWPFVKLVGLLVAWLVPPRCFSVWRRGKILDFLDAWGKYSFLDSWFLVLTLSAFALEWMSVGSADLKIQTTPAPAFYAFFAATVLSLILGHIASECHRAAGKAAALPKKKELTEAEQAQQSPAPPAPLCKFAASKIEQVLLLGCIGVSTLLALFGTFLVSFSFEMSGIAPQFLFGGHIEKSYSLFSVGMSVASGRNGEAGLMGLEIVFVSLAVLAPAGVLGLLVAMWLVPMKIERQRSLLHACRMLDAWASFDVAALVLAVACGEFAKLADWLVYEGTFAGPCNMVKDITKEECMKIEFHAFPALALLFLAGAALMVVPKVSMKRFEKAIGRRADGVGPTEGACKKAPAATSTSV